MNLFALFRDVNTKEQAVEYLQGKNILYKQRACRNGHDMAFYLGERQDRWICSQRSCRSAVALRVGTWLEGSKLPLEKVVWLIYSWSRQYTSSKFCINELLLSSNSTADWKSNLREVCPKSLLQNPTVVGGEGLTVEMHESCFTSKKHGGKQPQQQWVFGGVCRETSECFLYAVAEPTAETLLEAVSAGVRPGSTIVSDLWTSYGGSHLLPPHYTLLTVNKSQSIFADPTTGKEVEPLWSTSNRPKRKRRENVQHRGQDSYLCEFLWRKRHENAVLIDQIYRDIASVYPLKDAAQ